MQQHPLDQLCEILSATDGTVQQADLVAIHQSMETDIGRVLGKLHQKQLQEKEQYHMRRTKFSHLMARTGNSTATTKARMQSLRATLADIREALQRKDPEECERLVKVIVDIARASRETASDERITLESQTSVRPCAMGFTRRPELFPLPVGLGPVKRVLSRWTELGLVATSTVLVGVAGAGAFASLYANALKDHDKQVRDLEEIYRLFIELNAHNVHFWDGVIVAANAACTNTALQRLFQLHRNGEPDWQSISERVDRTLNEVVVGIDLLINTLNAYLFYLSERNMLYPGLMIELTREERTAAQEHLASHVQQYQRPGWCLMQ